MFSSDTVQSGRFFGSIPSLLEKAWQNTKLIVVGLMTIAVLRRYYNFPSMIDISLWDETVYLRAGVVRKFDLTTFGSPAFENGPLYQAYYYWLGMLLSDPINLYTWGALVLEVATLCCVGLLAWQLSRSLAVSSLIAGLALCSPFLLGLSRVSYLAAMLVMAGVCLANREDNVLNRLAVTTVVCFIASYVRPEFTLSLYLACAAMAGLLVYWGLLRRSLGGMQVLPSAGWPTRRLAGYIAAFGGLLLLVPFPVAQGSNLAMLAFGQHYARRWVAEHNSQMNPWLNWEGIVNPAFPGAKTLGQAIVVNPFEWLRFVSSNFLGSFDAIRTLTITKANLLLLLPLLVLLFIAARSIFNRLRGRGITSWLLATPVLEVALYGLASAAAMTLVYPHGQYAVPLVAAIMMLGAAITRGYPWSATVDRALALAAAFVVVALAQPLPIVERGNIKTIMSVRSLDLPIQRMLELDGGWCTYLKPTCDPVYASDPVAVASAIADGTVDAVVVSPALLGFLRDRHAETALDGLTNGVPAWRKYDLAGEQHLFYRPMRERP